MPVHADRSLPLPQAEYFAEPQPQPGIALQDMVCDGALTTLDVWRRDKRAGGRRRADRGDGSVSSLNPSRLSLCDSCTCATDQPVSIGRLSADIDPLPADISRLPADIGRLPRRSQRVQSHSRHLGPDIGYLPRRIPGMHADIGHLQAVTGRPRRDIRPLRRRIDRPQARIRRLPTDHSASRPSRSHRTATPAVGDAASGPLPADPRHSCSLTPTQEGV